MCFLGHISIDGQPQQVFYHLSMSFSANISIALILFYMVKISRRVFEGMLELILKWSFLGLRLLARWVPRLLELRSYYSCQLRDVKEFTITTSQMWSGPHLNSCKLQSRPCREIWTRHQRKEFSLPAQFTRLKFTRQIQVINSQFTRKFTTHKINSQFTR